MTDSPRQVLGIPRTLAIIIAFPPLVIFCAVMGFAAHAGLSEFLPAMPQWLAISLSALFPVVFLLGVGVYGALYDNPATRDRVVLFGRVAKWAVAVVAITIGVVRCF